jgi:predicted DNA-binding protein
MKRVRHNLYLNANQVSKLKQLSAKTGAPVSELVRRAIEDYLRKHRT